MKQLGILKSVHVGRAAPLGPDNVPSGFVKTPVAGAVAVRALGLAGDEQADLSVHGGPDKAVYAYALSHYPAWTTEYSEHADIFGAGSMGENLAIDGMDEGDICVGDVHAIGSALLQACQPRQPCFKLALRFNDKRLPAAMTISGRSGWYYRVLQEGEINSGDAVSLHARPHADFAFKRLVEIVSRRNANKEELAQMAEMEGLAVQWREFAREKLLRV